MSPSKREREYARRRYDDWQSRQRAKALRARQVRKAAIVVASLALAVAVIALVYSAARPQPEPAVLTPSQSPSSSSASSTTDPGNPCPPPENISTAARSGGKAAPAPSVAENRTWTATMDTSCGTLQISLDGAKAPQAVANFVTLAKEKYFNDTKCHRLVVTGIYVLQCGDPTATGQGGPGYSFGPVENAPKDNRYPAGTIAMARQANKADSNGSQFFIVYKDSTIPADSAGGYTILGKVTGGLENVRKVAEGGTKTGSEEPARPIAIKSVEIK